MKNKKILIFTFAFLWSNFFGFSALADDADLPMRFEDYAREKAIAEKTSALESNLNANSASADLLNLTEIIEISPAHADFSEEIECIIGKINSLKNETEEMQSEQAAEAYAELKEIKSKLHTFHEDLFAQPSVAAAEFVAEKNFEEIFEEEIDSAMPDLSKMEEELEYREQIIEQLLDLLEEKYPEIAKEDEHSSAEFLSSSLLAVEEHPIAASSIAIFLIAILWIFRGRLAEFEGFGVSVKLHDDKKKKKSKK